MLEVVIAFMLGWSASSIVNKWVLRFARRNGWIQILADSDQIKTDIKGWRNGGA